VDEYLTEIIRLEGRGDVCLTHCPTCPEETPPQAPRYRCKDCSIPDLFCQECCVKAHARHPLDRIEVCSRVLLLLCRTNGSHKRWNGSHFERVTLKSMGLCVQLGHRLGDVCKSPQSGHSAFTVIHNNSIHAVALDYCGCKDEAIVGSRRQQLLRRSWYPATHREPRTCTTFVRLETFHIMTLQGKVTT
jgi:hypothetical protein